MKFFWVKPQDLLTTALVLVPTKQGALFLRHCKQLKFLLHATLIRFHSFYIRPLARFGFKSAKSHTISCSMSIIRPINDELSNYNY